MGIKFFGQYLLSKRIINSEQLLQAIEYQQERNLRFGDYAVSMGFASESDIERLNLEQRRTDGRIGELGQQLGILSKSQVEQILTRQRNDHVFIGQVLVEKGFISEDALERELTAFEENQAKYRFEAIEVPETVGNREFVAPLVDLTMKLMVRIAGLHVVIGSPQLARRMADPADGHFTTIRLSGDVSLVYALQAGSDVAVQIATKIVRQKVDDDDTELIEDALGEFCNIVCGNAVARFAQMGKTTDISPPDHSTDTVEETQILVYPLHLADTTGVSASVGIVNSVH